MNYWIKNFANQKCFMLTTNKIPCEYQGFDKLYSYAEICLQPEFAWRLPAGVVLIDIDNRQDAIIFEGFCQIYGVEPLIIQTKKGKHFYFQINPQIAIKHQTKVILACGVIADIKSGNQNKKAFAVIKFGGKERVVEKFVAVQELPVMPLFAQVIKISKLKAEEWNCHLKSLQVGCRNQMLFNWAGIIKKWINASFNQEAFLKLMAVINTVWLKQNRLDAWELEQSCLSAWKKDVKPPKNFWETNYINSLNYFDEASVEADQNFYSLDDQAFFNRVYREFLVKEQRKIDAQKLLWETLFLKTEEALEQRTEAELMIEILDLINKKNQS